MMLTNPSPEGNFIFYGIILPERADVNFDFKDRTFKSEDVKITSLKCTKSKLVIECENLNPAKINIDTLKSEMEYVVRLLIDSVGYTVACGYDVEITASYNLSSKEYLIFGVHECIFENDEINLATRIGIPHPNCPIALNIFDTALGNPQIGIALSDFREAIKNPRFTIFHCYRVLDGLKYNAPHIRDDDKRWEWLLSELKIKKDTKDSLLKLGGGEQRHGKITISSWENRKFAMQIAWEAIRRFVYLQTDPEKLNELPEF